MTLSRRELVRLSLRSAAGALLAARVRRAVAGAAGRPCPPAIDALRPMTDGVSPSRSTSTAPASRARRL
jgi:hypothetical protein